MTSSQWLEVMLGATVECWLLHLVVLAVLRAWFLGSIFESWRAYMQARGGLLGELLDCPLCLSYHAAWICEVLLFVPVKLVWFDWLVLITSPVVILAAVSLAYRRLPRQ